MHRNQKCCVTTKQKGVSLIGLMIGLLLSALGVLAGMTMFRNMVVVAVDTTVDARHDAQLASAMLTMQMEIQNAGKFIKTPLPMDVVVANLIDPTDTIKDTLLWRYNTMDPATVTAANQAVYDDSYVCNRLIYNGNTLSFDTVSGLNCKFFTNMASISEGKWTKAVLASFDKDDVNITFSDIETNVSCWPYGHGDVNNKYHKVTITADSAASRATQGLANTAAGKVAASTYEFCLPNKPGVAPPIPPAV